jgi:cobalt-zinc-cadmium efflux system outer membrane protein
MEQVPAFGRDGGPATRISVPPAGARTPGLPAWRLAGIALLAVGVVAGVAQAGDGAEKSDPAKPPLNITLAAPDQGALAGSPPNPSSGAEIENQTPQPSAETAITLEELVREALEKNPGIKSAARRVRAMRARIPQARSLPDPVVSGGWMGDIVPPFGVQEGFPPSARSISATQEIPFPGKLKLRGEIADREAEAAWWEYESTRRQVVADVKVAYYDYFYYRKAVDITRKDRDLLEKLTKIAEVRYKVGKGIQQDVLKAQVELSRLLQRLTIFEQEEKTARAQLNTLLYRDPEAPLPPAASFEHAPFAYSLDELYEMARHNDPQLKRQERMIERSQYAVNLARKAYDPDLRIGYTYQQRPMLRDSHGVMFSINIPIFYKSKQREGVIQAAEELTGARRSLDNRQTLVNFAVKQQYLQAKASEELARLYSQAIVPQSSLALESSMSAYEVGKADFLTMLDNFVTVLDYELNYYRELSNFQMALSRLEPLVGQELTK